MATGAVKMDVQFVEHALAIVVAHRVLHGAGAIVYAVNEQVCMEQRDGSGDSRFIDCPQHCFQVRKAECLGVFHHCLEYQKPYSCRLDASIC